MAEPGEIIRHVVLYSLPNASQVMNVFYWTVEESQPDERVLEDLEDWTETEWAALWETIASNGATIIGGVVDILLGNGHVDRNVGDFISVIVGNVGGQHMNAATSAYIKADTEVPKTRGSKYIPGLTENNSEAGKWDSTVMAVLVDMLLLYVANHTGGINNTLLIPGVLSRLTEAFVTFTGSGYVTDIPAYQRRRKPGVGS